MPETGTQAALPGSKKYLLPCGEPFGQHMRFFPATAQESTARRGAPLSVESLSVEFGGKLKALDRRVARVRKVLCCIVASL